MDWEQLLQKWIILFELKADERKELYDSLHDQTRTALGLIAHSAQEKALIYMKPPVTDAQLNEWLISSTSLQAWGGYMLYLMHNFIDPVEQKIGTKLHDTAIDTAWFAEYEKNMCHDYVDAIHPIITLFLDKATSIRTEQFLLHHSTFYKKEYKLVANIRNYLGWAAVQGYVIGMLEFKTQNS